jgi:hypothetical protein
MHVSPNNIIDAVIRSTRELLTEEDVEWATARMGLIRIITDLTGLFPYNIDEIKTSFEDFILENDRRAGLRNVRRHKRIVPKAPKTQLVTSGGMADVHVRNVSVSGLCIETHLKPPLGSEAVVGSKRMIVVRHFEGGIAGVFLEPVAERHLSPSLRL